MSKRKFDLIAFDWDGTLYDSTAVIVQCIQAAIQDVGGKVPDHSSASFVIGMSLQQALVHAAPDLPANKYPELVRYYQTHYRARHSELVLFAGVREMLLRLGQSGHLLAIATGKSRRGLDEALTSLALDSVFDATRTADETAGKPDPKMLCELMEQLDVPIGRTLMIGDTTHDLAMARAAGCACVAVTYGAHQPSQLSGQGQLFTAHSLDELSAWIY